MKRSPSDENERSVASAGSVADIVERLQSWSCNPQLRDLGCGRFGTKAANDAKEAAVQIAIMRFAVRQLLDGVNERYPDKHPREWTCPHMAALDRLVPPPDAK